MQCLHRRIIKGSASLGNRFDPQVGHWEFCYEHRECTLQYLACKRSAVWTLDHISYSQQLSNKAVFGTRVEPHGDNEEGLARHEAGR